MLAPPVEPARTCQHRFCRRGGILESAAGTPSLAASGVLPSTLREPVATRLRYAGMVSVGVWLTYAGWLYHVGESLGGVAFWTALLAGVVSALTVVLLLDKRPGVSLVSRVGNGFLVANAFALALAGAQGQPAAATTWAAVFIGSFPLLVPGRPGAVLAKGMLAATMTPIAFLAVEPFASFGALSLARASWLFAPVYAAAVVAACASHALFSLAAQVSSARHLGMYELEARIAQGGMGEVWRARHQLLSRPAAVKLVKPIKDGSGGWVVDAVAQQRFEREAQVTASLQSPHTVQLYDFGVTQTGTFYYVMELLDGTDLEQLVTREGPLEPTRVIYILEQVLDSLAEAHGHGLVHRDIKPANIYVSRRGLHDDFVKVLDFGLVKLNRPDESRTQLTADNSITGTPAYLAPEIVTGEARVDGRADLYALGAVAYYLLTGKLVFEAQGAIQMAIAHVTEAPVPPTQRTRQSIPKPLERLVLQCLEKAPEARPQSALEMLRALESIELDLVGVGEAAIERQLASAPSNTLN